MYKDKFNMILNKNEEILWSNSINVLANTKKRFLTSFLIITSLFLLIGIEGFMILQLIKISSIVIIGTILFFWILVCLITLSILKRDGENTFLCITNERIIKRNGAFNHKFNSYSLKNVGTITITNGIFDSNGEIPSATLIILVKDYHINNSHSGALKVNSLNNAYEAYKLLNELTKGNNEVLRIKTE